MEVINIIKHTQLKVYSKKGNYKHDVNIALSQVFGLYWVGAYTNRGNSIGYDCISIAYEKYLIEIENTKKAITVMDDIFTVTKDEK